MMESDAKGACSCSHHKVIPILMVLFGLTFLLGNLNNMISPETVNLIWPVLVIIAGGTKLFHHKCGCC